MTRRVSLVWLGAAGLLAFSAAAAQENLSFEQVDALGAPAGWRGADTGVTVDSGVALAGERSLRVARATASGVARLTQRVAAAELRPLDRTGRVQRVRLAGAVRTEDAAASLWLRIDGSHGPLFLDSYGFGREAAAGDEATSLQDRATSGWRQVALELPLPSDVTEVAFGVSVRGQGTAWFDDLELTVKESDSLPTAAASAVRYVDAALDIMREHSLRRAAVDWPTVRSQTLDYARGAKTAEDAHLAVRFAVRELGDRHSYLQSPTVSRVLATTAVANARTGAAATAPSARGLGRVAYLDVPSFAGGTQTQQVEFAEKINSLVQVFDKAGSCGWIVDLRRNSGGNLWPMLAGVGPLLGDGELAASVYPDGRRIPVWHRDGQAGFGDYTQLRVRTPYRLRQHQPVALLIGPGTASSAEVLAAAFLGGADTRSFGAATRGLSAGNRSFALSDGASLVLTVAATSDASGRVFTGPLLPDVAVGGDPERGGMDTADDGALDAAMTWLMAGDSCR